jgi:hypothetical protein
MLFGFVSAQSLILVSGKSAVVGSGSSAPATAIIVNHTSTNLLRVPLTAINNAKANLHIAYGHTSHGSQIISGMNGLTRFPNAPYGGSTYTWNNGGYGGALDLRDELGDYDKLPDGTADLGNPNRTAWANSTRYYLKSNPDVNVIIWSWCNQVELASESDINIYLNLMNHLEMEYPRVTFVYMTGHLDGTGEAGNLNQRNEQIRNYVRANNKILFDFADIESFDPDGLVNYMKLNANANCDYNNGNWATTWQNSHTEDVDWFDCDPAHTQALNGNQKAYAAWWLWARLGGWKGNSGDIPIIGDWNGDGKDGIGIFRPSSGIWSLDSNENLAWEGSDNSLSWGLSGDTPVIGDWNGDGKDGIGIFRPSSGIWSLDSNENLAWEGSDSSLSWGLPGDKPVIGDWNGDGKDGIGIFRPSSGIWSLDSNENFVWEGSDNSLSWGLSGDTPVIGDWNDDGKDGIGIFRPSSGIWSLDSNENFVWEGSDTSLSWGLP